MSIFDNLSGVMKLNKVEVDKRVIDDMLGNPSHLRIDLCDPDALMDGLRRQFGGFEYIVLRLNGTEHTYKAKELIDRLRDIEMEAQS